MLRIYQVSVLTNKSSFKYGLSMAVAIYLAKETF